MDFDVKKSGQIPAFGNWDYASDVPITQYFDCARQAGLIRHTSSICECPPCVAARGCGFSDDLYATDYEKPPIRVVAVPPRKQATKVCNGGGKNMKKSSDMKEQRKQMKVYDVKEQPRNQLLSQKQFPKQSDGVITQRPNTTAINVKPVDEDLYKIPPELLQNSKRKKMLGFFSRCLVPPCNV